MKMSTSELSWLRKPRMTIGTLLVEAGMLDEAGRKRVLQAQTTSPLRFGEAAVALGLVSERDVRQALCRQFQFSYVSQPGVAAHMAPELFTAVDPFGAAAEPLRVVRSQLSLRWFDKASGRNMLALVSHDRGEGRSHVAANLAVAFSQAGETTLLIDADLRHPRQQQLFGLRNQAGLSTFLAGQTTEEPMSAVAQLPGLFVMPAGPVPPNPGELFARVAWRELVLRAQGAFDVVIVDTPALGQCDEAALIATGLRSALVVARSHVTRTARLRDAVRGLHHLGVEVVGTVLNDLPQTGTP